MIMQATNDLPILEMRGITKRFPGVRALDNVTFSAEPGTIHALVGENGAGKSTLLKILGGIYQPDAGSNGFCRRLKASFNSPQEQIAGVRLIDTSENFQKSRLPCAVFSHQGMDRSGLGRKCHVIKGTNPGESFGNAGEMQGSTHEYYDLRDQIQPALP